MANGRYVPLLFIIKSHWVNLALSGISVSLLRHTDASFLCSAGLDAFHGFFNQQHGINLHLQGLERGFFSLS